MNNTKNYSLNKLIPRIIGIQFRAAPGPVVINTSMSVFHSLSWTAGLLASHRLFDAISNAAAGLLGFYDCVIPLLIMAGVTFGQQILNGIHNFFGWTYYIGKSGGVVKTLLHEKLQKIDPARFEDTAFLDDLNKAREGIGPLSIISMTLLNIIFFYGVYFASVGFYLFHLSYRCI